jgi:hypothetical protein
MRTTRSRPLTQMCAAWAEEFEQEHDAAADRRHPGSFGLFCRDNLPPGDGPRPPAELELVRRVAEAAGISLPRGRGELRGGNIRT